MSNAMPYVKWHGRDWLGDPLIRMVTPEIRGVWIDLLCAMMQAEPYGHLAVAGKAMSDEQAARLTGLDIDTYKGCLKAIEDAGISSRTPCGMLYSRRLVRDYEKFTKASECGKRGGGNPALKIDSEARSQKPEAKGSLKLPIEGGIKVDDNSSKSAKFQKPTAGQVAEYGKSIGFNIDGNEFVDFYASKGWLVGKTPMKDWKACVRTWKKSHEKQFPSQKSIRERIFANTERRLMEART